MNIIIPIGGKGERFSKCGYTNPKPLIPIFNKPMILHVLDNLRLSSQDKVFIIYYNIDVDVFEKSILERYPSVVFIALSKQTSGAAETIYLGLQEILSCGQGRDICRKTMLLDCDAFYGQDVVSMFSTIDSCKNAVFYTKNTDLNPIFSYIVMDDLGQISQIEEKQKISDNANTGIYCFSDIEILYQYAKQIVDLGIVVRGECYTSCIIAEMLKDGRIFMGIELDPACVFNAGTPLQLETYIRDTFVFLFDLDGTLVITEDIYYEIWKELLETYKITLTKEVFTSIISGNNDSHVFSRLLPNISLADREMLSMKKDERFSSHIDKIRTVDGAMEFLDGIYRHGHKIAIVTNCNRATAELILSYLHMNQFFDTVIIGSECVRAKPYPDPYVQGMRFFGVSSDRVIIFEDSKTGILSAQGVSGRSVIGIQTLYSAKELFDIGVDRAIENYIGLSYRDILEYQNMNINTIKRHIINSMGGWNIMDILQYF
jgi:HAD superfamily hydrolase (TIGR01509 family)